MYNKKKWVVVDGYAASSLPRIPKNYRPSGRRNQGRQLKETYKCVRPE